MVLATSADQNLVPATSGLPLTLSSYFALSQGRGGVHCFNGDGSKGVLELLLCCRHGVCELLCG